MSLTEQQIEEMVALSAPLMENPLPWVELSQEQQAAFRLLMPQPSFDSVQRHFLSLWWLPFPSELIDDLNAGCPTGTQIVPREDGDGGLWLSADLLSDALDGRRLSALLPILETLPLIYRPAETWPVAEEDE